jgi:hypothetical protein
MANMAAFWPNQIVYSVFVLKNKNYIEILRKFNDFGSIQLNIVSFEYFTETRIFELSYLKIIVVDSAKVYYFEFSIL